MTADQTNPGLEHNALRRGNEAVREAQFALDRAKSFYERDDPDGRLAATMDVFIKKLDQHCELVNQLRAKEGRA